MDVKLYGIIAELAGTDRLHVQATDTEELKKDLATRIKGLDELSYAMAVERELVQGKVILYGDEEVALLPPFAGG